MTCIRNAPSIASLWPGLSCLFPHLSLPTRSFAWCSSREHCPFPDSLNLLDFCLCFGLLVVGMCFMNGTYPSVVLFQPWGPYCCDLESMPEHMGCPVDHLFHFAQDADILDICNEKILSQASQGGTSDSLTHLVVVVCPGFLSFSCF